MTPTSEPARHWTAGRPVFGLRVAGVGLTRTALLPLGWAAVPWAIGPTAPGVGR